MSDARPPWLLLIHQLPAKPAYIRVKIWRRLRALGAVTVKNAVYVLPASDECREDFAWLAKEIEEAAGEALVCEAALVKGLSDHALRGLFDAARDEDYARISNEARAVAARLSGEASDGELADAAAQTARCASNSTPRLPSTSSAPMAGLPHRDWCRASRSRSRGRAT